MFADSEAGEANGGGGGDCLVMHDIILSRWIGEGEVLRCPPPPT